MRIFPIIALSSVLFALSCGKSKTEAEKKSEPNGEPYTVFVSIAPLASVAESIGGSMVKVEVLIPPGADPHTYEPTPGDVARLAKSAILFVIGKGLDDWSEKLALAAQDGPRVVGASAGVPELPAVPETYRQRLEEEGLLPKYGNPHVWLDPYVLGEIIVPTMSRAFIAADPENRALYWKNSERLKARLVAFGDTLAEKLAQMRGLSVIEQHGAFAYFFRRFGIRVADVIEPLPGKEPSPRLLASVIQNGKRKKAFAVITEPQAPPNIAETVAKEIGAKLVILDPIGRSDEDYFTLIARNAEALIRARQ